MSDEPSGERRGWELPIALVLGWVAVAWFGWHERDAVKALGAGLRRKPMRIRSAGGDFAVDDGTKFKLHGSTFEHGAVRENVTAGDLTRRVDFGEGIEPTPVRQTGNERPPQRKRGGRSLGGAWVIPRSPRPPEGRVNRPTGTRDVSSPLG